MSLSQPSLSQPFSGRASERGQVTPLVAASLVVVAMLLLGIVHLSQAAVERAQARTAADAAALAAASDVLPGEVGALAAANGGGLVELEVGRDDASAEVVIGGSRAQSRAQRPSARPEIAPAIVAIVARLEQLGGEPVEVLAYAELGFTISAATADRLEVHLVKLGICQQMTGPSAVQFQLCLRTPTP